MEPKLLSKTKYFIAYTISRIFGPFSLICVTWLVTALKSGIGFWKAIGVYSLIFIFSIIIPFSITTLLVVTKRVENIEWSDLNKRKQYFPPIVVISIMPLLLITYLLTTQTIFHLSLLFSVIVCILIFSYSILNFKASGHMAIATIAFSTINLFFHNNFLWLFFLLLPIAWSRFVLKAHTKIELLAGVLIPAICIIFAIFIFGEPQIPN